MNGRIHTERKIKNIAVKQAPRASGIQFWDPRRTKLRPEGSHIPGLCVLPLQFLATPLAEG